MLVEQPLPAASGHHPLGAGAASPQGLAWVNTPAARTGGGLLTASSRKLPRFDYATEWVKAAIYSTFISFKNTEA